IKSFQLPPKEGIFTQRWLKMVTKKTIYDVQEDIRSSIEDFPDSPRPSMEGHVPWWDKSPETVLWSNAAFRTSLTSSNKEEEFSPRNSLNSALDNNPIPRLKKIVGCHKMKKVVAEPNSPALNQRFLPGSLYGKNRTVSGLKKGLGMSEEEAKIKAELEKEIEKGLEEEIKDGILSLTRRLAQLHARQKARTEEYHRSNFDKPCVKSGGNRAALDSWCNSILYPQNPFVCSEGRRFKSPAKRAGYHTDSEKRLQREFDWVRTLRSGESSSHRRERIRNHSPRCSRSLFSEPKNERRRSISEPRHGCQCAHTSNLFHDEDNAVPVAMKGNGKCYAQPSPKDSCSGTGKPHTTQSARKMGCRKGNGGGEEAERREVAEGSSKEKRLFLIDMMNKLKVSDTNNFNEQPKQFTDAKLFNQYRHHS
ncbi:hypothetical protein KI387_016200, partial [Taxus chinensis]